MSLEKYVLTFKAKGVSIFVTDVHRDVYKHLHVVFLIRKNNFYQFFPAKQYYKALNEGLKFYKNTKEVRLYIKNLKALIGQFRNFFQHIKKSKKILKNDVKIFFNLTTKLCKEYTKMNIEYTDKAFSEQDNNINIHNNLNLVKNFKDVVRIFMNTVLFEPQGYSNTVFKKLGKQFYIPPQTLHYLTRKEILSLFNGQTPNITRIKERNNFLVVLWNKGIPIQDKRASKIIDRFLKSKITNNFIKGFTANPGNAKGLVKVIKSEYSNQKKLAREISNMKPGSILVAETTAPELVLACKKAAAIITDLGGLMSHAAIISRELNIPCIVGTGNATKILKDGDRVEVDANLGIVRKV